ncbi:cyclic nucleotide-binding domain-containing protein [Cohnella sp. CFH 77786]|uniref:Crp/Fnr family transcriptional regulator n=1 Tax=Cohnella sp. CFH 77786 TaxID=2662265 RepID=UPI001C610592|nr:Crp/Fnr family transcriptional regulator [Cohnella sp. CFH 77786]MBW5447582.1 cyclic nucleotide-binding domain-containing protein [Cohnella sp. CFH 77786]
MDAVEAINKDEKIQAFMAGIPEYIRSKFVPSVFAKDSVVAKKDAQTDHAYLVLKGLLRVVAEFEDGNHYLFAQIKPFSFVSDLEALSEQTVNAVTVVAAEDSVLLRMDIRDFIRFLKTDHGFLLLVSGSLAKKMFQRSVEMGAGLYKAGLQKVILYLLKRCQEEAPDPRKPLILNQTRPVIASEIGISVKTLNRSLQKLKQAGRIHIARGKIQITEKQYGDLLLQSQESPSSSIRPGGSGS